MNTPVTDKTKSPYNSIDEFKPVFSQLSIENKQKLALEMTHIISAEADSKAQPVEQGEDL